MADVAMYVGRVVPNRTQGRQHPILKLSAADNFAICYYAGGEKNPKRLENAQSYHLPIDNVEVNLAENYQKILKQYQLNLLTVEARIAQFYDQAAVPPDLERSRDGILAKIAETEIKIKQSAKISGWLPPQVSPTPKIYE